jgi:glycosyltransferase involved in cell wall biosynthesis
MESPPVICQLLHSLIVGGAEVLAARLARRLAGRHRFVFACLDGLGTLGRELRQEGFAVEVVDRRPGVDLGCMRRLARLWRTHQVDLVHAHQYTPFFYALAARGLHRRPPVLFTEHGRWFPDYPRRKRIFFNRLMLRRGDRVVAVGGSVRDALVKNEGIAGKRIQVVYNGVDVAAFDDQPTDRAALRARLGFGADELVILQVARLDYLKDHLTAIRTIQRVAAVRPDARLVLVGEGPERGKIEAEIGQRGVSSFVRLLGLRTDIAELLHASDLFLLTSISEGIPVTLIEALAARLPIVSTGVGGIGEVVEAGKTGLLAPSGDDAALADAVLQLANDATLRSRMGHQGHARAQAVFSEAQMHAGYQAVYEEMLGKYRGDDARALCEKDARRRARERV